MEKIETPFLINGAWRDGRASGTSQVFDPATGSAIASLAQASPEEVDEALAAAQQGFARWRLVPAFDRSKILRRAADLVRERAADMAAAITREQGKPLAEAKAEATGAADHIDWYAEEGRRAYGRVIPSRQANVRQLVLKEPIGPVAAFTPWNFPVGQLVRKIAGALAAGCSIIAKPPEDAPTSCIMLARCFQDAGLPDGALNILFGVPSEISEKLITSPIIRKVSFTGSVPVGRLLGSLSGTHLKRTTMELGGHAPFIVCADADLEATIGLASVLKFRNAGQVCAAPTRFFVQRGIAKDFVEALGASADALRVAEGTAQDVQMGPLANQRRQEAMREFVDDAVRGGGKLVTGGSTLDRSGFFFAPTIVTDLAPDSRLMTEEPFGPIAAMVVFDELDEAIASSNSHPFGLAAFAFTHSTKNALRLSNELEVGMVSINHFGIAAPETPFGGVKDSGYGSEGGVEGLEAYLSTKFVSQMD